MACRQATWLVPAVAMLAFCFAEAIAFADDKPATGPAPQTRPSLKQRLAWGTLEKVDGNKLTIKPTRVRSAASKDAPEPSQVTVTVDDETIFRGDADSLAKLEPGRMRVDVLKLPPTRVWPARIEVSAYHTSLQGILVRIDGKKLIVKVEGPGGTSEETTVVTDDATRVMSLADLTSALQAQTIDVLKPGVRVSVKPATGIALEVHAIPDMARMRAAATGGAREPWTYGVVKSVEGNGLTIRMRQPGGDGETEKTINVEEGATITVDTELAKVADILPEMSVVISRTRGTSPQQNISASTPAVHGEVEAVEGSTVAVCVTRSDRQFETVLVPTDEKTRFVLSGKNGGERKLKDVKPGMRVDVTPRVGVAKKLLLRSEVVGE